MSHTIILNSNNVIGSNKNTFKYFFPSGSFPIKEGTRLCLSSLTIPYSWFNISSFYNNNKFTITYPTSAGQTTYNITIPDGFYTVTDLNLYLQNFMVNNSLYLLNGLKKCYYISILYNTTYYGVQFILTPVPTSAQASSEGLTTPVGHPGHPVTSVTPQITINNQGFGTYLGFSNGSYPTTPQATTQSFLSDLTPIGSTVNSLTVRCNIVNNRLSNPSDVIDSIPITSEFGSNINYNPAFQKFVKCSAGTYNSLEVSITDQSFNNISMKDNQTVITLLIEEP